MTTTAVIEKHAGRLLIQAGVEIHPVPVESVARHLGLEVRAGVLGDDVSGVLVLGEGRAVIGYNSLHVKTRQRFTVAHEIGHYELHRRTANLFIDKQYFVAYRAAESMKGALPHEREANAFAAALLMPRDLLKAVLERRDFDLADEEALQALADEFDVSKPAMTYRLANLGVLGEPAHPRGRR